MSATKVARDAEERGEGICRTCLLPIWNEGGTIGHREVPTGWSDRIKRGGDSVVCFNARDYRHVPLTGREAEIYDIALTRSADGWFCSRCGTDCERHRPSTPDLGTTEPKAKD